MSFQLSMERTKLLLVAFLLGCSSLMYELYSIKVIFFFFAESSHALAIAISSFLAGLAFSSLLFSHPFFLRRWKAETIIIIMQLMMILYAGVVLKNYQEIPNLLNGLERFFKNAELHFSIRVSLVWIYLFIPAFFLGGIFPLINGLYQKDFSDRTKDTGKVYFWDTLGAVFGSMTSGFYMIPQFGLTLSLVVPMLVNVFIILLMVSSLWGRAGALILHVALIMAFAFDTKTKSKVTSETPKLKLESLPSELGDKSYLENLGGLTYLRGRFGDILYSKSSPYGAVTVGKFSDHLGLFINYRAMCLGGQDFGDIELGVLAGKHTKGKGKVLNIGLGCGNTANYLNRSENVKELTIVEINPIVVEACLKFFSDHNGEVLNSSKVSLLVEDGVELLRKTKLQYDAIVIDIEEPSIIHSSPLYTLEYFYVIKSKMTDEGIFAFWSDNDRPIFAKILYNTIKAAFPYVAVRSKKAGANLQFYASLSPLEIESDKHILDFIGQSKSQEINTLDNRVLEKHYDVSRTFDLPTGHIDHNIRK